MKPSLTPFYDAVAALQNRGPRFFVPGHKANPAALPELADALRWDFTEVAGADDLSHPTGPLRESQRNMARVFGAAATLYSAAGTSACVQAMLALHCPPGSTVAMARGVHVSAVRALGLLGLVPHWIPLRDGRLHPADAAAALQKSGAKALFFTGTDYYGRTSDTAALADACHAAAVLLCDNAHGAHRRFLRPDTHPLTLGAHAVCDSAHKTLFALTPAALLHLADAGREAQARQALNLFSSTSPSYPVLISLDICAGRLLGGHAPDYMAAAQRLAVAARRLPRQMVLPCDDALRLVLCPGAAGLNAAVFHSALLASGLASELFDGARLVLMASPFNTEDDYIQLEHALQTALSAAQKTPGIPPVNPGTLPGEMLLSAPPPKAVLSVRQALFAPRESLPVCRAASRVCACLSVPCPPAVPLVVPGQEITPEAVLALAAGGISHIDVVK